MQFANKHTAAETTIFTVMSGLATQHNAINLSQGFPDFSIDEPLAGFLAQAAQQGFNQYCPMPGLPLLRNNVAADLLRRYGVTVNPDTEITITPGATYGIYNAFATILSPGDEAILFEPAYDSYIPNIQVTGAKPICIPLQVPGFNIDWDLVKAAITPKTKAIIVNTPHNPCGSIWTAEDRQQLADLVRETDIVVISDEVYEQLVFDGNKHYSVLEHEELRARSFIIFSFGKVFNNTGWKIGYTIAPSAFTRAYRMLHQYTAFSVNTPSQYAIAMHLASGLASNVRGTMENKRNLFLNLMKDLPFTVNKPTVGSYFQVVGYSDISDLPDLEFAKWLTKEYGVATIPISAFYHNRKDDHLIRFCFAKKDETLQEACNRLAGLV